MNKSLMKIEVFNDRIVYIDDMPYEDKFREIRALPYRKALKELERFDYSLTAFDPLRFDSGYMHEFARRDLRRSYFETLKSVKHKPYQKIYDERCAREAREAAERRKREAEERNLQAAELAKAHHNPKPYAKTAEEFINRNQEVLRTVRNWESLPVQIVNKDLFIGEYTPYELKRELLFLLHMPPFDGDLKVKLLSFIEDISKAVEEFNEGEDVNKIDIESLDTARVWEDIKAEFDFVKPKDIKTSFPLFGSACVVSSDS